MSLLLKFLLVRGDLYAIVIQIIFFVGTTDVIVTKIATFAWQSGNLYAIVI